MSDPVSVPFHSAAHKRQLALEAVAALPRVVNTHDSLYTAFKALKREGLVTIEPLAGGDRAIRLSGHRYNSERCTCKFCNKNNDL